MARAKKKAEAPMPVPTACACRSCGQDRQLDEYRFFRTSPTRLRMDFCVHCEQEHGTLQLYRRYNAYGTPEIIEAVFATARIPAARRTADQARLLVEAKPDKAPETNAELLRQEIARREMARRRLIYYVTSMMPAYTPGWVHQDICRRLEKFMRDVEEERSPRLILAVPPRHGKSALASDMFPSWVLGHHPDWPIIISSYAQELPINFSRAIRDRIATPQYQAIFDGTQVRSDARGVESWATTKGGVLKAIGVGGGLTGFGGRILIADDLIKDAAEASSEVVRQNAWDWYQMVFRSRLAPGGGILLIGTRWHWHDPIGRALEIDAEALKSGVPDWERENWEVISYPAIAEHDEFLMPDGSIARDIENEGDALRVLRRKGEALHPERYPINELRKIKNTFTTSNWSALYQQNPTPDEGDFFKKDDFRYRWLDPAYRSLCRVFVTTDYAIAKKQRNDFTVAGAFALDANDDLYVLEIRRGRWGTLDIARNLAALVVTHDADLYAGEQGQIHHAVWPIVEQELELNRKYVSVDESLVPIQDKETRARPLQGRMQRHKLFFSYDTATRPEIYDIAERELLQFPNGANDDIVDMLAWGARLALNVSLPQNRIPVAQRKSWTDKLRAASSGGSFMAA